MTAEYPPPPGEAPVAPPVDRNPERFRLLVENCRDIIAEVDLDGRVTYGTPNVSAVLGFALEELIGTSVFQLVHPEDLDRVRELFRTSAGSATCRGRHKDGTWRWIEASSRDFTSLAGEKRKVLIARDVTERKEAEAARQRVELQLLQAQKQTLLGTLTGGIAHDFNNILTTILGNAELAQLTLAPGAPERANLERILVASNRAQVMVQRLLSFGRGAPVAYRAMPLGPTILEAVDFLRPLLPAGVRIELGLADEGVLTVADATQLHQAVMNLVVNAVQAMPAAGGLIEIGLRPFEAAAGSAPLPGDLAPGAYLRLSVRDTGVGIPPEALQRIFEPYFTSKQPGKGTGLGLTVVQQVMRNHRGTVRVASEVGRGSVFELFFPRREPNAAAD